MQRKGKIFIGAGLFVVVLLLFIVTLLPQIVKSRAVEAVGEATGRVTRIDAVSINPFTLTVTIDGVSLDEKGRAPLLAIRRLRVSLSSASIFRRALVLDEITVEEPQVSFVRTAPNRYSFSDIIDRRLKAQPDGKKPILFSLNNIVIRNGSVDFSDKAVGPEKVHTVRKLDMGIPFISNIPYYAESYVAPQVTAVVNGTAFSLRGRTKPLSKSMQTSLHLGLQRMSLPEYLGYSPVRPPIDVKSGFVTLDADLDYHVSSDRRPEVALSGILTVEEASVSLRNGKPLVKLPLLQVKAAKLDFARKKYAFSSILLDGLEIFASRNKHGEWMYDRLLKPAVAQENAESDEEDEGEDAPKQTTLPVDVSSFLFKNGTVHFSDLVPAGGFTAKVAGIEAAITGFSTTGSRPADYKLSFTVNGGKAASSGSFSLPSAAFSGNVAVKDLPLEESWPYLSRYLAAPFEGRADLSAAIVYSPEEGLSAEAMALGLRGLSTRLGKGNRLSLASLDAAGASYRQKTNHLEIENITLSRGIMSVSREEDGSVPALSLVREAPAHGAAAAPAPPAARGSREAPPFSYRIGKIQCSGIGLAFTDRTREGDPVFTLNDTRVSLTNLTGSHLNPAGIRLSTTFGKDAPISAGGFIIPAPFSYTGTVKVGRLPLSDFESYLPENLNVILVGGALDANLKVALSVKDGKPAGVFQGNAGVRSFHSIDAIAEQDLLRWESLQLDGIKGEIAPFLLDIRQIALNNLYSRIIVRPDGTLNLQNLVAKETAASDGATGGDKVPPAAPAAGTAAPMPPAPVSSAALQPGGSPAAAAPPALKKKVSIGAVTIQEGTVAFSDEHLPQPFSTTFYHLGGRVSGLSSEESKFADVDLRGNLENRSPLQITGRINPLRDDLLVDLKITFRDIELPGVSPYSGTYLGYRVDQGKLYLDLKYLIEKKQLNSENKVFIDRFTFGEKVESEKATKLPVHLAVALLKDKNGEIHLDLPVTGRTDDPQFSVWGVVWQVVKNVFTKAVTSPLALLSATFGGGTDLSNVSFAPGASTVSQGESEKLHKLARALAERPGIRLEVCGIVDREKDPEGYRIELLKKKMKGEKFLQMAKEKRLPAGQTVESLEILPEEHAKLLKAVYEKEKFPKPRTVIGTLKELPDAEMTKLILANTTVGEEQLRALAHERCAAVTAFLVGEGRLPPERVFEKSGDIYGGTKKEGAGGARVEFGVVAK
ncbi:DUF748 domain-containing protein [Geomonas sp. RF6]|uniref:DUF748 domain-containing protein n=1 Tax=Geomonas sp. RF6 TaxID=2897342 RepID=UPI001E580536|nr:DUF748 domain-containing protein [Geomonas sp. RF6]UFS70585.1 DUF748 domain-containing protein [Geomonas sp. RF6]